MPYVAYWRECLSIGWGRKVNYLSFACGFSPSADAVWIIPPAPGVWDT